jgi:prepilin-type N-terminal cleavage/methylation domain-containing protein
MMTRRSSHSVGFTLIELILVMVILTVVAGMAAPSLRGLWASSGQDNAAAQMVALANWARGQAVNEGRVYRLNIDEGKREYWLTCQEAEEFVELGSDFGRVFSLPEEVEVRVERDDRGEGAWIEFCPNGRSEVATIVLKGGRGTEVRVGCLSPTELFKVLEEQERRR